MFNLDLERFLIELNDINRNLKQIITILERISPKQPINSEQRGIHITKWYSKNSPEFDTDLKNLNDLMKKKSKL